MPDSNDSSETGRQRPGWWSRVGGRQWFEPDREAVMVDTLGWRLKLGVRIDAPSRGADDEVERFGAAGRPDFHGVAGNPGAVRP